MPDRSVWFGLYPKPYEAKQLVIYGGFPPEALHITVAYISADYTKRAGVVLSEMKHWTVNLVQNMRYNTNKGRVSGFGYFGNADISFALAEVPGIEELRKDILTRYPSESTIQGFIPHISLTKGKPPLKFNPFLVDTELTFDALTLHHGGHRIDFPFTKSPPKELP